MARCSVGDRVVPCLVHGTTHQKAAAIQMVGFRIGPKTKPATAYCDRDQWDDVRCEAYQRSEALLEEVRRESYGSIPSRRGSIFFGQQGNDLREDDPETYKVKEDDWGQPIYDFGFGKTVLFTVHPDFIPCRCGVGATQLSDEVFRRIRENLKGDADWGEADLRRAARRFWDRAEIYDPNTLYSFKGRGETYDTEVWCPCPIPRESIVGKMGGKPREE